MDFLDDFWDEEILEEYIKPNLPVIATGFGYIATAAFFFQYVPQILLNYRRKSCKGFSAQAILIKLVGAAFMAANFILADVPPHPSVILYALVNVSQYSTVILQFIWYHSQWQYALYLGIPVLAGAISVMYPETQAYTSAIKPVTQILSHIAILYECYKFQTCKGVSMMSQHFNMVGGLAGILMCAIRGEGVYTTLLYVNSCGQAVTIYLQNAWYAGKDKAQKKI